MTTGAPDFNTALKLLGEWLQFLDEKEAELRAKMARSGETYSPAGETYSPAGDGEEGEAATRAPLAAPAPTPRPPARAEATSAPRPQAVRVPSFSPFDVDAPDELPEMASGLGAAAQPGSGVGAGVNASDAVGPALAARSGYNAEDGEPIQEMDDGGVCAVPGDYNAEDEGAGLFEPLPIANAPRSDLPRQDCRVIDPPPPAPVLRRDQVPPQPIIIDQPPAARAGEYTSPAGEHASPAAPEHDGASDAPQLVVEPAGDPAERFATMGAKRQRRELPKWS